MHPCLQRLFLIVLFAAELTVGVYLFHWCNRVFGRGSGLFVECVLYIGVIFYRANHDRLLLCLLL